MTSYVNTPQLHANAVKNPKMLGGPFIDYDGARVNEVRELLAKTNQERASIRDLSAAIGALDGTLRTHAKGHSLHPLYAKVPEILKGYVELTYDLNNHPSFRLIEPLIYRSQFYDDSLQSLMLQMLGGDDRPFILSTPRLDSDDSLHLKVPFKDSVIDELFKMKSVPKHWFEIKDMLGVEDSKDELVRTFFTSEAPPVYQPYRGSGVRWRYFGHACILIEANGVSILVDPVLSYTYESNISRYTYLDLPESIDYVLITHNHQDHVLFETMLQLRHRVRNIVVPRNGNGRLEDPSLKLLLNNCGFRNVIELAEMEELRAHDICITGVPFFGEHADLGINTKMAWHLRMGNHSYLFVADSCNIEPMAYEHVHRVLGDVEVLFLGMECDGAPLSWLYGPLLTNRLDRAMDESRRLSGSNCEQGMRMIETFHCNEVYVYAMGQEPWLNYIMSVKYTEQSRPIIESNALVKACQERGIIAERLFGEKEIMLDDRLDRNSVTANS
jgi:L-ascorbate metabolism protein UlaG (beta-lactamase superfamily)